MLGEKRKCILLRAVFCKPNLAMLLKTKYLLFLPEFGEKQIFRKLLIAYLLDQFCKA
jgi:hypothetical protein